jgi:hypothetical protein
VRACRNRTTNNLATANCIFAQRAPEGWRPFGPISFCLVKHKSRPRGLLLLKNQKGDARLLVRPLGELLDLFALNAGYRPGGGC